MAVGFPSLVNASRIVGLQIGFASGQSETTPESRQMSAFAL